MMNKLLPFTASIAMRLKKTTATARIAGIMVLLALLTCTPYESQAMTLTSFTGGNASFDSRQRSLALNMSVATVGIFPSGSGGAGTDLPLGAIRTSAFNFLPGGAADVNGSLLPIASNAALFSLLGTTYGGNGTTNFGLPNLETNLPVGAGSGPGLSPLALGQVLGQNSSALTVTQMPAHTHSLGGGGNTGSTGGSSALSNLQSSLGVTYAINTGGTLPGGAMHGFLGEVNMFAVANASGLPAGWTPAEGQLLSIASNASLFSLLGTTYGGDGTTTLALPDFRGRTAIGVGARLGFQSIALGQQLGSETIALTQNELPSHTHTVPPATGATGGGGAFSNVQPSLGVNFLIALTGLFPSLGSGIFDGSTPFTGEVVMFAGNTAPSGYAFSQGQLLSIASNPALFSLLGTTYGGDGTTTFALPDLRGLSVVDESATQPLGSVLGSDLTTLTIANLPAHAHQVPTVASTVPEPATAWLLLSGLAVLGGLSIRRRKGRV